MNAEITGMGWVVGGGRKAKDKRRALAIDKTHAGFSAIPSRKFRQGETIENLLMMIRRAVQRGKAKTYPPTAIDRGLLGHDLSRTES